MYMYNQRDAFGFSEPPPAPMQLDPTPLGPLRARRPSLGPTPQLRFPPFETIVGFVSNNPILKHVQINLE